MTMYKAEMTLAERGLASTEDILDTSIQRLEDYIEKRGGNLITATRINTDDTKVSRTEITRKQKWEEKLLYGRFKQLTSDISHEKALTSLRKTHLKIETESLLIVAQNIGIRTNHIKARINKTQQNSRCRLCSDRGETINHIISECSKFALKGYKTRHDWVDKMIHWELCRNWSLTIRTNDISITHNLSKRHTNSSGILRYKQIT